MSQSCWGCKHVKEIAYTDPLGRRFCPACHDVARMSTGEMACRALLAVSVPFAEGDVVECRTAGERYDGTGTITTVSMDLKDGGTPVYPIFHVAFDVERADPERAAGWFCENDLALARVKT